MLDFKTEMPRSDTCVSPIGNLLPAFVETMQAYFDRADVQQEIKEAGTRGKEFVLPNEKSYSQYADAKHQVIDEPIIDIDAFLSRPRGVFAYRNRGNVALAAYANSMTHMLLHLEARSVVERGLFAEFDTVIFAESVEKVLYDLEHARAIGIASSSITLSELHRRRMNQPRLCDHKKYPEPNKKEFRETRNTCFTPCIALGILTATYIGPGMGYNITSGPVLKSCFEGPTNAFCEMIQNIEESQGDSK